MNFLPKKTLTATEALVFIMLKQAEKPVSSREISEYMGVSLRYLEQILQRLVKSGILKGVRGPAGGYLIGRERRRISLLDIYQTVSEIAEKKETVDSEITEKLIHAAENKVFTSAKECMQAINLQDLYDNARNMELRSLKIAKSDFVI